MATFKIAIRPSEIHLNGTVNIKVLVIHNRKSRYISTDYDVLPKYFDKKSGTVKTGGPYSKDEANHINGKLQILLGVLADKAEKTEESPVYGYQPIDEDTPGQTTGNMILMHS
jgi:hypothetical protein